MSLPALACSDLVAGYGDLDVVRGVSLTVGVGEVVALVGANGSGKTTILRALAGQLRPKGGTVLLGGRAVVGLAPGDLAGLGLVLVPEGRGLFPEISVRDSLLLGFEAARPPKGLARPGRAAYRERLAMVHGLFPVLLARAGQAAGTLSGGEQQMLAIGRALMSGPRVLLLDEPSLGLGPRPVELVYGAIRRLRASGETVVLVEENVTRALTSADRAYVLRDGQVALDGPGPALLGSRAVRQAYLGL